MSHIPHYMLISILTLCALTACTSPEPAPDTQEVADIGTIEPTDMSSTNMPDATAQPPATDMPTKQDTTVPSTQPGVRADVTAVTVTGASGAYNFNVTIKSPDTGCTQYANWWEVLSPEGALLYRRILGHSHVDEQPFTRSGGTVPAQAGDRVIVRAHMNEAGYGGAIIHVTLSDPIKTETSTPDADFAADVRTALPQPNGCAF